MIDYHDYIGEKVKIIDKDGETIEGKVISYEVGIMEDKDYDSLGIEQAGKGYYIDVSIPDIASIKIVGK